jgi:hypothetical protein
MADFYHPLLCPCWGNQILWLQLSSEYGGAQEAAVFSGYHSPQLRTLPQPNNNSTSYMKLVGSGQHWSSLKNRSKEDLLAAAWDELDGAQAALLPSRTEVNRTC